MSAASGVTGMRSSIDLTIGKAARRLVPLLCVLYLVSYLDRVNLSFAALRMNSDLNISTTVYGIAASVFFVGYIIFEVPSNLILHRVGARLWISRILITWGLISAGMSLVSGEKSLIVVRVLLGIAEAGFFPGVVVYLSQWFPREFRARVVGMFMIAIPLSSVIGAPLSSFILEGTHGFLGLDSWRWMFIVEAVPAVLLGLACLRLLPSRPTQARWLDREEAQALEAVLERESLENEQVRTFTVRQALGNIRVVTLSLVLFFIVFTTTGIAFFLPQIVKTFQLSTIAIGLVTAIPYLVGAVAMVLWSRHSDKKNDRVRHIAIATSVGAVAFVGVIVFFDVPILALICMAIALTGVFAGQPVLWALPTTFLTRGAAAAAIALINSVANISGVFGPALIGWTVDESGGFRTALLMLACCLAAATVLIILFGRAQRRAFDGVTTTS